MIRPVRGGSEDSSPRTRRRASQCGVDRRILFRTRMRWEEAAAAFVSQSPRAEYRAPNTEYRVPRNEYRTLSTEHRIPRNEYRTPSTECECWTLDTGRAGRVY